MRSAPYILIPALLIAAACDTAPSSFSDHPLKRAVNVDDHQIYVVPQGSHEYVAWGGEEDRDGFVQYRQKRGIELVSGCMVSKVISAKNAPVLRAEVKC
jgi:hypothetical protein